MAEIEPDTKRQRRGDEGDMGSREVVLPRPAEGKVLEDFDHVGINHFSNSQIAAFQEGWNRSDALPFPHLRLENIVDDESFLKDLIIELQSPDTTWFEKRNDLYE